MFIAEVNNVTINDPKNGAITWMVGENIGPSEVETIRLWRTAGTPLLEIRMEMADGSTVVVFYSGDIVAMQKDA